MIQGRQSVLEEGGTSNSSQRPEDSETVGHVSPQLPTKTAPADTGASQQTNTTHPHDPASRASSVCSDAEPDSSDTDSSGSDEEKGEILEYVKDPSFKMKNRHSGFNKFSHRNGFKKWIRKNKPLFGGIIETRVKQPKIGKLVASVLPGWSYADNYSFLELGKIWILWHSSVKVVVLAKSLQQITCEVHLPDLPEPLIVTIIYAANNSSLRAVLWTEIELLAVSPLIEGKPWSVLGDFNQTLSPQEHSSPRSLNIDKHMRLLSQCLIHSDLEDLHFRGEVFTWWNKRKTSPIAKKLDRILVNDLWYESFPDSLAHFDNPDFSDHACSTISLKPNLLRKKKPFKFYNFLLQNPDFSLINSGNVHQLDLPIYLDGYVFGLHQWYESGSIGYHPRTSEVKISHLMFADDVMVFFDGKADSLHVNRCGQYGIDVTIYKVSTPPVSSESLSIVLCLKRVVHLVGISPRRDQTGL
ncbi:hypothetical protein YC2023_044160 [Brassica napus]